MTKKEEKLLTEMVELLSSLERDTENAPGMEHYPRIIRKLLVRVHQPCKVTEGKE